jgi:hypothetical protein
MKTNGERPWTPSTMAWGTASEERPEVLLWSVLAAVRQPVRAGLAHSERPRDHRSSLTATAQSSWESYLRRSAVGHRGKLGWLEQACFRTRAVPYPHAQAPLPRLLGDDDLEVLVDESWWGQLTPIWWTSYSPMLRFTARSTTPPG